MRPMRRVEIMTWKDNWFVKNILGGLFKKSSTTPEENVNLKLNANIALKGTLTSSFLITAPSFAIPGISSFLGFLKRI